MKLGIAIIVPSLTVLLIAEAWPAEPITAKTPTTLSTRPPGELDFSEVLLDGRGTIVAYTERIADEVKPLAPMKGPNPLIMPDDFYFGTAKHQEFVTTFYLVGKDGPAVPLWVHHEIATADTRKPLKTYAVLLTPDTFVVVYDQQIWGMFCAAVRRGADASRGAIMPLRGFALTKASIVGPLKDGTFSVIVSDDFRPQNRYRVKLDGNNAVWELDGVWDASSLVWRKPGPESQPAVQLKIQRE